MKSITTLLFILLAAAGCNQGYRTTSDNNSLPRESAVTSLNDSGTISVVNPLWQEMKITVGGSSSQITGFTSEAIQTAIDAIHNSGKGGTVILASGEYNITAPVRLYSNIAITGSGAKTILKKCKGFYSAFAIDADYGELQITVADASGFKTGMGVAIYDEDQRSGWDLTTAIITAVIGNIVYIDDYLLRDYHADKKGTVSNSCSVISAVGAENVSISNLTVDGSKESNEMIDGCRAGAVYLHKVHKALVENVVVKNFNSDGISWQLTEYVTVRNCEVYGCTNSGLHPGTGSPFTLVEGNNSHDNGGYGLFVCWRVRNGIVRNNIFHNNGINGICTGHKDTDLLFADNHVYENGADGISLRGELPANAPHRTIIRNNIIENNGMKEKGYGISVNCKAEGVIAEDNTIRNTGKGNQVAAVLLTVNSLPIDMKNNKISGHQEGEIIKENR